MQLNGTKKQQAQRDREILESDLDEMDFEGYEHPALPSGWVWDFLWIGGLAAVVALVVKYWRVW